MRPNNFDLARLILASIVCVFHCGMLSHAPELAWSTYLDAGAAVEGFFAISGCLIFASWERSPSPRDYALKRSRRILPGYYAATALCLLIAFLLFRAFHAGKFLAANVTFLNFLHPGIEGAFDGNPENDAMNGVLWTIRVEIMFYAIVPIAAWLGRKVGRDLFLVATAIASILYRYAMDGGLFPHAAHPSLAVALPGQWSFFAVGALIYHHRDWFRRYGKWLVLPALALYAATYFMDGFLDGYVFRPVAVPVLVLGFCLLAPEMKGPTRWGDFSYGIYLVHWPIIQTLVAFGVFARWPYPALGAALSLVALAAAFSWFCIEKPMLHRGPGPAKPSGPSPG
jgi:peptidoglycan/LPS O-acetylase OafA/YrhL